MNPVEIENLCVRRGRIEALSDISLAIRPGALVALLGLNGAGKSTLLSTLIGALPPYSGDVRIFGKSVSQLTPADREQVGYFNEAAALPLWMTIERYLCYNAGFYARWNADLCKQLVEAYAIPLDRKLKHCSRGMRLKAQLVALLASSPKLLLLDEPFSGLDVPTRDELLRLLLHAGSEQPWTVILSSHEVYEVETIVDHVVWLHEGVLRLDEDKEALQSRFRQITWQASTETAVGAPLRSLSQIESSGRLVRFVDSAYEAGTSEALYATWWPGSVAEVRPLTLREIFSALVRAESTLTASR